MLKNQLQNRSNCARISDFIYKNTVQGLYMQQNPKMTQETNKNTAESIQQFKCILGSAASHLNSTKP